MSENVKQFVTQFVTQNRLEQGLGGACNGEANLRYTGDFMKWFGADVKKESVAELEASGLQWNQVAKAITAAARDWLLIESKRLI